MEGADELLDPRTMRPGDEGMTEMALFAHQGKVVMRFARSMEHVIFDPGNAVAIAKKLIDIAADCGANVTIEVPRREISVQKRNQMVVRAMLIMKSMANKSPRTVCIHIIDSILSALD